MCTKVVEQQEDNKYCKHYFYNIKGEKIDCNNIIISNDNNDYCNKHHELKIRGNLIEYNDF